MGMRVAWSSVVCVGCLSTSSYQTAKMLPVGATRVSAAVNNYEGTASDPDGDSQSHGEDAFEAMVSHGVTEQLELGGKLAFINAQANIFHLLAVPKLSLVPDKVALVAPTGVSIMGDADVDGDGMTDDEGGHFYESLPGVVFSQGLNQYFELTGAAQLIWLINDEFDDSEFWTGLNIGVRLRPPGAAWAIQPEIGFTTPITNRDDNLDYILQYGLAFHYDFGGAAGATDPNAGAGLSSPPPP